MITKSQFLLKAGCEIISTGILANTFLCSSSTDGKEVKYATIKYLRPLDEFIKNESSSLLWTRSKPASMTARAKISLITQFLLRNIPGDNTHFHCLHNIKTSHIINPSTGNLFF